MEKQIFVLEDDKDIGFILNLVLFEAGYMVRVYETVAAMKAALKESQPDLLLMDVRLPDGNGMDLCEELKSHTGFSFPVVMMSADWHVTHHQKCAAEEYIAKPFDLDVMVSKIDRYLKPAA